MNMNASSVFIAVSVGVLAVVIVLVFLLGRSRRANRLTPLASLAFAFVLAGICFGENRFLGYSLFGIGVILSVIDILHRSRSR
jgi:uncharacterized membrane protein